MKIALISFTAEGANTCRKIAACLESGGHRCSAYGKANFEGEDGIIPLKDSLAVWAKAAFAEHEALIFIGACGIAVRAIAPHIRDKTVDPAVVVVDELGKYAISLLSGHLGGANDLAAAIADAIGAEPVITTATDLNRRFAVDDWAKKNHLSIGDMRVAKEISAALLNGDTVGVVSDNPIDGVLPEGLRYLKDPGEVGVIGFRISVYEKSGPFDRTLHLIPNTVTVGIGCRKGIAFEAAENLLAQVLKENNISVKSVEKICSIDIKREEEALKELADRLKIPFQVFTAEELDTLAGEFSASEFVNHITGVDNVCERAAVLGSHGELIVKKQARNGVTIAIAVRKEGYRWKQL